MSRDAHPRTVLEQLIRDRHLTLEAFSAEAERHAVEHGMRATLSPRHAQRLAAGHRPDGRPLGPVRPATRQLLESMFGQPVEELLSPTDGPEPKADDSTAELLARLAAARAIDHEIVTAFQERISLARVIDRRLGAPALLTELREQIRHMRVALHHATNHRTRTGLARVLADACALAGWLSLDQNVLTDAWHRYGQARTAALESESTPLLAYTSSASAAVLIDAGERAAAIELTSYAQEIADDRAPRILRSWLAAAHGEARAADGQREQSLRAFDRAEQLADRAEPSDAPYLVFGDVHLARWRGNALARLGDRDAIGFLDGTLGRLDKTFIRAEAAMHADLAEAYARIDEPIAAASQARQCARLSRQIGSVRQWRRVERLTAC